GVDLAGAVGGPALEHRTVGRGQAAEAVERQGAGTREELLALLADHEEAVAGDRQVGGAAGVLCRALRERRGDAADAHAEADLRRVGAAAAGGAGGRGAGAADGLAEQVLEDDAARLVA